MKKKVISLLLVVFILSSAVLLSACGKSNDTADKGDSSKVEQVLNLAEEAELPTLDPSLGNDRYSFRVLTNVMEGLYRLADEDKIVDGVAVGDPVISEDGKTWEFTLREDAKWSNGEAVTAHDFVYSWQKTVNPETKAEYANMMYFIVNGEAINKGEKAIDELGVTAKDDYHLVVNLENATPYFKSLLVFPTFFPQNEKFVEKNKNKFGTEYDLAVYNGPFVLSSWKHEVGWTYSKNEKYWDKDVVKLEKINVKVVKDANTVINLYESGEIDKAPLLAEQVSKFKEREDFIALQENGMSFIAFNHKHPLFSNIDAREAFASAVDTEAMIEALLNDGSIAAKFLVPENFAKSEDGSDFREKYPVLSNYDLAKAKEHWKLAKETYGQDEIKLSLLNYDFEISKKISEYVKEQLEKHLDGLTVEIKTLPFKQKLDVERSFDYDFAYSGWGPDFLDPMTFLDLFTTNSGNNYMQYSNPEYDALLNSADGEFATDHPKRWETMQEAEKIFFDDKPIIPLYQRGGAYLVNPNIRNLYTHNFAGKDTYKWAYVE